jgi:hypothetical protein
LPPFPQMQDEIVAIVAVNCFGPDLLPNTA